MSSRIALVLIALSLSLCLGFGELSREEYCEKVWRYDLECALNKTLSPSEIEKVSQVVSTSSTSCAEIAWETLKWIQENVRYDQVKASLPLPVITIKGRNVEVQPAERYYQTPEETVGLGRGICGDIAILTTALMLSKNCKSYVALIDFRGEETDHLASLVFLDDFYVLDQILPPMDLGSYYNKWLREGKRIEKVTVYEKGSPIGNFSEDELKIRDRKFTEGNLKRIRALLVDEIKGKIPFGIPEHFREKLVIKMRFNGFADYYTDTFADKIAELLAKKLLEKVEGDWNAFTIEVGAKFPDLEVALTLYKTR